MLKKTFQCLLLTAGIVFFQSENSFSQTDSTFKKKFSLSLYNFNYLRDYEYFSPIMEGYTLFGSIVQPAVEFKATDHVTFKAGVFVQQNFGEDSLRIRPSFLLKLENKKTQFQFGNYRSEGYNLIEPLYFTDKLITENLDNGFLLSQVFGKLNIIQWLDWERAIQNGSDFQERVWGGMSLNFLPLNKYYRAIQFPVACYLQHTGGQINQIDSSFHVRTLLNASFGIKSESYENPKFFSQVGAETHFVYYKEFFPIQNNIFKDGNGIWTSTYMRLHLDSKKKNNNSLKIVFSYWQGKKFLSPKGNPLMQSVSVVYPKSDYNENERRLLFLNLKYETTIDNKINFNLSFEPYYDFKNKLLEYGIHLQTIFPFERFIYWRRFTGTPRF
ncbi:MAG TPA: hypothetical protein DCQ93_04670 [Bacteroidetes bacterium]|nr:hypothetical protein [Bacteroidota bacterium]